MARENSKIEIQRNSILDRRAEFEIIIAGRVITIIEVKKNNFTDAEASRFIKEG